MAYTHKNAGLAVTDSMSTAYTCPAATTAVLYGILVANIDGTNAADISVQWTDDSNADAAHKICHTIPVPADASLSLLPDNMRLVLDAGDTLQAQASATGDLELTLALMEIS